MSSFTIEGVFTALITPIHASSSQIDFDGLAKLLKDQETAKVSGIILGGSTGQGGMLTTDELCRMIKMACQTVTTPIWAAASGLDAFEKIAPVIAAGAKGILISPPAYVKPPQRDLVRFYRELSDLSSIPIMAYHIPGRSAATFLPKTAAEILKLRQVVAIKESSGSLETMIEFINRCPASKSVLAGDDWVSLPSWAVGSKGVVSVASNLKPDAFVKAYDLFKAGRINDSHSLWLSIYDLQKILFCESNPIAVQWMMGQKYKTAWGLRRPLSTLDEKFHADALKALQA